MPLWLSAIKCEWLGAQVRGGVVDLDFDPRREQAVVAQTARDNRRSRNCARRQSLRNVGGSPSEESAPVHGDDVFGSFLDGLDASPAVCEIWTPCSPETPRSSEMLRG